jgi:hypothetical protein
MRSQLRVKLKPSPIIDPRGLSLRGDILTRATMENFDRGSDLRIRSLASPVDWPKRSTEKYLRIFTFK